VNTMPEATLHATAAHGEISDDAIRGTYDASRKVIADMEALGVGYDDVMRVLEDEAVQKFAVSWQELLSSIETQLAAESGK
jgi:transaldolase